MSNASGSACAAAFVGFADDDCTDGARGAEPDGASGGREPGLRMPGVFAYVGGAIARLLPWLILPGLIVFA
jgi:hypothetical protein